MKLGGVLGFKVAGGDAAQDFHDEGAGADGGVYDVDAWGGEGEVELGL